jgi:hypothetical protein
MEITLTKTEKAIRLMRANPALSGTQAAMKVSMVVSGLYKSKAYKELIAERESK